MKILFLNPVTHNGQKMLRSERCQVKAVSLWPPLSLAYSAAVLRNNGFNDVSILDAEAEGISFSETVKRVLMQSPDILVIQDTTPTLISDKKFAKKIKEKLPKIKIAFAGLHSTTRPQDILDNEIIFALRNEPEWTLLELVKCINDGKTYEKVEGLSFFREGKVINNSERKFLKDLDALPFPARDLLKNQLYINPVLGKPFTLIKTSRGCPFRCIYCTAIPYYGAVWRSRSVDNIIQEIREVIQKYGITDFLFHSDTFNLKKDFVIELCQRIISEKLNITWMSNCRVDYFDEDIARSMKNAGSQMVSFGIESGSQEMLDNMKKGITLEQVKDAIKACKKTGLRSIAYFVFGLPGETSETMQESIDFAIELDPYVVQFFVATPFPGTEFYSVAEKNGWLTSHDWTRYLHGASDVIEYPELDSKFILKKTKQAYKLFYFRPGKILSYVYAIRSLGQLRNNVRGFIRFYKNRVMR